MAIQQKWYKRWDKGAMNEHRPIGEVPVLPNDLPAQLVDYSLGILL